jgi:integrase
MENNLDPKTRWLTHINKVKQPKTVLSYSRHFDRLLEAMKSTPEQFLASAKVDINQCWCDTKETGESAFTLKGMSMALCAVKSFLRANGFYSIPNDRLEGSSKRVTPIIFLDWESALKIASAASRPYNMILRLILHSAWGLTEFLAFNSSENWRLAKESLGNSQAEYFQADFSYGRKNGDKAHYTLIPRFILQEIFDSSLSLPFVTESGAALNLQNYKASTNYIDHAFRTAKRRALVSKKIQEGKISPHDLRSAFRSRAQTQHVEPVCAEFALFHDVDSLNYNRATGDVAWQWSEIKKIYGPAAATESALQERDKLIESMQEQIKKLEGRFEVLLKEKA